MTALSKAFILCGVFYIIIGMSVGLYMAANQDFTLRPLHSHLNLMGWVSMLLFGLYYAVVKDAGVGKLPKIHFTLANIGMLMTAPGLFLFYTGNLDAEILAKLGSSIFFLSILTFGWVVLRTKPSA